MQENVRQPVVGNDESISLGHIEPLDDAGELDNARGFLANIADRRCAVRCDTCPRPFRPNAVRRRHDCPTLPLPAQGAAAPPESTTVLIEDSIQASGWKRIMQPVYELTVTCEHLLDLTN